MDLNKFHINLKENKNVNLNQLLEVWQENISHIEQDAIISLRLDGLYYEQNLENSFFGIGLGQNAIQYLSDLIQDYGSLINDTCLCHKRMLDFSLYNFLNPFNYVVDHPVRDYVQLFKCNCISFDEFVDSISLYNVDVKIASLIMCQTLYPYHIFDSLDKNLLAKEKDFKIDYSSEKEIYKIKKVYLYLKSKYNIRPIDWLEL